MVDDELAYRLDRFYMSWALFKLRLEDPDIPDQEREYIDGWIERAIKHESMLKVAFKDYYKDKDAGTT